MDGTNESKSMCVAVQTLYRVLFTCSNVCTPRHNKLMLDVDDPQASSEEREGEIEHEHQRSLSPRAPKLSHLPPSSHVPSLEDAALIKEDTPAILNLMKDSPNVMTSSVILSNLHTRRMSAKSEGTLGASFNKGGALRQEVGGASSLLGRRQSQGVVTKVKGMVDEVSVFTLSGSGLIRSKSVTAASVGTNHTAIVTSELNLRNI